MTTVRLCCFIQYEWENTVKFIKWVKALVEAILKGMDDADNREASRVSGKRARP